MAGNPLQLKNFGKNVYKYFSERYAPGDYFFLSVDERLFKKLLTYEAQIMEESLLKNFKETGYDWEIGEGKDNYLIAIAIATYEVLLASKSNGTNTRPAFIEFYKKTPNENIKRLWKAAKEYFLKTAELNLCIPSYDNSNYVTYPNYQIFNNTQLKFLFYSCFLLKLPVKDQSLELTYFDSVSQKYKYKLTYIEGLIFNSFPKASKITYKNIRKVLALFLFINYLQWDGSKPIGNEIQGLDEYDEKEIDEDFIISLCPQENYSFYMYKGNEALEGDISGEIIKELNKSNYITFFYNPQFDEFENNGPTDFRGQNVYLLTEIPLGMDSFIVKDYLFGIKTLSLYYFPFEDAVDKEIYLKLKSRIGHTSKGNDLSLLGGIKIGGQYLEYCGPDFLELNELIPIKDLVIGTNKIGIPGANETIKISITPCVENRITPEFRGLRIPGSEMNYIDGFSVNLPFINGEEEEINLLDEVYEDDFFDHLMAIKERYIKKNTNLYSILKRGLYGR